MYRSRRTRYQGGTQQIWRSSADNHPSWLQRQPCHFAHRHRAKSSQATWASRIFQIRCTVLLCARDSLSRLWSSVRVFLETLPFFLHLHNKSRGRHVLVSHIFMHTNSFFLQERRVSESQPSSTHCLTRISCRVVKSVMWAVSRRRLSASRQSVQTSRKMKCDFV